MKTIQYRELCKRMFDDRVKLIPLGFWAGDNLVVKVYKDSHINKWYTTKADDRFLHDVFPCWEWDTLEQLRQWYKGEGFPVWYDLCEKEGDSLR